MNLKNKQFRVFYKKLNNEKRKLYIYIYENLLEFTTDGITERGIDDKLPLLLDIEIRAFKTALYNTVPREPYSILYSSRSGSLAFRTGVNAFY